MFMIGELMGLPEADHAQLLEWSDLFATGGDEVLEDVVPAVQAYANYINEHIAQRRGSGREDLVSLAVNADSDGEPLTDVDLVFETMLVLVGVTCPHRIRGREDRCRHGLSSCGPHPWSCGSSIRCAGRSAWIRARISPFSPAIHRSAISSAITRGSIIGIARA